jgi:hypothetical protein
VRDNVDVGLLLPTAADRERAIAVVEQQQPIGGPSRGGHLRQANSRMEQPPCPRLADEAFTGIVEDALVVEMLEPVRPGDDGCA